MAAISTAMTLYDIEEHLLALTESVETVTPDQEEEFLMDFRVALISAAEKRDAVANYLAHLEQQQEFAAKEISRLQKFKKARESEQARLEGYVSYCILSQGKDGDGRYKKLQGNTTVMFLRYCPASVEVMDMDALPLDYQSATLTMPASWLRGVLDVLEEIFCKEVRAQIESTVSFGVDKRAIKAAIEGGVDVPGAQVITDKTALGRK
jgi:hypothetical protein